MESVSPQVKRRLALEQIISRMARNFVQLNKAEEGIQFALCEIGKFSGASRAYIFEFQSDNTHMDNTFEWCREGVSAEMDNLKNQEIGLFPWWMEKIRNGDVLTIKDVSMLGSEAKAEREILEMQGIKSVLVMPLIKRGSLSGFVGFDNVDTLGTWQEDDGAVLSIAAEFFSNVFDRLKSEKELNDAKDEVEASLISLQSLQNQLVQQEHLVAIGQLAAGVAHEINNPLSFVLSNQKTLYQYTQKLMAYVKPQLENCTYEQISQQEQEEINYIQGDLEDLFEDIDIGLQRVKKIVESLRFFSRVDSMQTFEPYNLAEGISNTVVIIRSRITESTRLILDIPDDLPPIMVYGSKINQVLLNLIVNALDAIVDRHPDGGGELTISAVLIDKTGDNDGDSQLQIQVKDNGIGMSEDVQQKIFNPFFTTKPVGKGTGLGMILVYDIIKNIHMGEILISSELGKGTTVTITLPVNGSNR